jgi:hypothetical protein
MNEYYKRDVSLMDQRIFPRESLDNPMNNLDKLNSTPMSQSDKEIIDYVVSDLKRMPKT